MTRYFSTITPRLWFWWVISTLVLLCLIYLVLHAVLPQGSAKTKLSTPDITTISSLLYDQEITQTTPPRSQTTGQIVIGRDTIHQTNDQKPLNEVQRQRVMTYISTTYHLLNSDTASINRWIHLYREPANLINALGAYVFPVHSYFWLYDGRLYAEVIFWTWFGLIASLLFSVSESLRKGEELNLGEVWVHIAKFFYAPLCSLVIFLGLSLAVSDKSVIERIDYSPNQILVAFIMGFFSGKLVQFLQAIKNVIFPGDPTDTKPISADLADGTVANATLDDIKEAIIKLGDSWRVTYPNVTGIALQTKQTSGQLTGQLSILFEVTRKVPGLAIGALPPTILYTTADGRAVTILTDVAEVGLTYLAAYTPGSRLHLNLPTAPGGSLRRQDQKEWGTLGLELSDGKANYVLTCYHVLCADLLSNGQMNFSENGSTIVAPGEGGSPATIGTLVGGRFSQTDDFALVRLTDNEIISDLPVGQISTFFDIIDQPGNSLTGQTAYMVGAFSNFQSAKILAPYQAGDYTVPGLTNSVPMKGLIKTERMANHGDSGAAVYIEEDGHKRVIGLLVGFNNDASYVLPISSKDSTFCSDFGVGIP